MYSVGEVFEVTDFHLVDQNSRLPRCPFCYRSPTRTERIQVRTGGRRFDFTQDLISTSGMLHQDDSGVWMELESLEVVIP